MPSRMVSLLAVLVVAGSASAALPATEARLDPALARELTSADPGEQRLVFVHGTDIATARAAVDAARWRLVGAFEQVGIAVAAGPIGELPALRRQPGVTSVEAADTPIEFLTDTSHVATRSRDVIDGFDVDGKRGNGKGKPRPVQVGPYDGAGISIAVVDSGIFGVHPAFQTPTGSKLARNVLVGCTDSWDHVHNLAGEKTTVVPGTCPALRELGHTPIVDVGPLDTHAHGSYVAAIAAGTEVAQGDNVFHGAAPGATLVGVAVGPVYKFAAISGLNWVLENHAAPCGEPSPACPPIRVVNNSWGLAGEYGTFDEGGAIDKIQESLIAAGVIVVWAAGNSFGDGSTARTNSFATSPTPGSISVAGYEERDMGRRDLDLWYPSSRGKRGSPATYPDLAAPGALISSACVTPVFSHHGSHPTGYRPDGYCEASGTSAAAPHVAGIVAQMLQADPGLTPAEIEDILEDTADPFGPRNGWETDPANPDSLTSFDRGHGLVDAAAAVARVLGLPEPPDPEMPLVDAEPGGSVTEATPVYRFTGGPVTNENYDRYRCNGLPQEARSLPRSEGCHYEYVQVDVPPGGATLRVDISTTDPHADFDLFLRDPHGASLGWSTRQPGSEPDMVITRVEESGIYTVFVTAYAAIEGTFDGIATLVKEST